MWMSMVLVPIAVEQDEDGAWCAHADLGPLGGANGEGDSREEAIADVRQAIALVFEVDGVPPWLTRVDDTVTVVVDEVA
jgi:predicted RNase H-like HicB family nuclease